jgi:hypothetical protein
LARLFLSGYQSDGIIPEVFRSVKRLRKPQGIRVLPSVVTGVLGQGGTGVPGVG